MSFTASSLPGQSAFGALVTGLTSAAIDDADVAAQLRQLWADRGMIVFRGVDGGEDAHVRLSRIFGELMFHPMFRDKPGHHPELIDLNHTGKEFVYEVDGRKLGAWLPWHSDLIYTDEINRGGILRSLELPAHGGGETGFIDRIHAYAALPEDLKARIEGLEVLYRPDFDATNQRFGRNEQVRLIGGDEVIRSMNAENRPRTVHPLVYTQAETGRKVLNISPWFSVGIYGMENDEGDAILKAVIESAIRPELIYVHDWQLGDMVLWDNWRMMHSAAGIEPSDHRRMQRTTIAGDYALGRTEHAGDVIPEEQRVSI
jgi:taurine dioxygenase